MNRTTVAGWLCAMTAMRSPGFTPCEASSAIAWCTRARVSAYESRAFSNSMKLCCGMRRARLASAPYSV